MSEELDAVAFAGSALAPFFMEDPRTGNTAAYEAMATLDVDEAAEAWPFADADVAREALALMQEGLSRGADDDELMWEYRRLFVGPAARPAPPWGSVYTDRDGVIFGETTTALRAWMRANGIERTVDERTPEDHIGLMLAMMAFLAQERPDLLDEYLAGHFLTWAPHFLDALDEATEHPFYQGLARLTKATLQGIQAERALDVTLPRFYR